MGELDGVEVGKGAGDVAGDGEGFSVGVQATTSNAATPAKRTAAFAFRNPATD